MKIAPGQRVQVIRGLLNRDTVSRMQSELLQLLTAQGAQGDCIDSAIMDLSTRNRTALAAVYDVVRETRSFQELITSQDLFDAVSEMVGTKNIHCPYQHTVFRMDLPSEGWRGFNWHQDFAYNVLSQSTVTAWTSLTPSGEHNGSIYLAEAASDRVYPIEIRKKRDPHGKLIGGTDAFISPRFSEIFEDKKVVLEVEPGDVVLFGCQVVHRSGYNPGPKPRVSIQARFGDLYAPEMIQRNWANRRKDGFDTFSALHPELVELDESVA